ncbi:unnamed protein product [Adineta ricciae]|uniref:Uncharacterized protein n=1 Tax=Adineta ricciae TaxID=249248 RepID=A0A815FJT1_ADIRI|nr:unnamed protein product [Adineta ricciae]CAF1506556.1 unnamed protein product [Adineta ricciae]
MFVYILLFVFVIGAIFYINRFQHNKASKQNKSEKKIFSTWTPVLFESPRPVAYPEWSIETTRPLPYRPFKYGPDYFVTMGISRMNWDEWIELDNQWNKYHQEKLSRLSSERSSRLCQLSSEAEDAALETMELLSEYLVYRYPSLFQYENNDKSKIRIKITGEIYPIRSLNPLKYASLLIQDDLALMIEGNDGQYYLKGGSIVLPGFWRLEDKFQMPLSQIHMSGDVPKFEEKLKFSMERFFQKMAPQHPVVRYNYFIQTDGNLAWSSSIGCEDQFGIGWSNAKQNPPIEQIYFRSERQTLRRLPRSEAILFTIHPYFIPLIEIAQEPGVPGRLASAIRSWPDDVSHYKGKQAYEDVILKYLDEKHQEQCENGLELNDLKSNYPF